MSNPYVSLRLTRAEWINIVRDANAADPGVFGSATERGDWWAGGSFEDYPDARILLRTDGSVSITATTERGSTALAAVAFQRNIHYPGKPAALTLTLGFTRSDRDADYVSFDDGYRPGAAQDTHTIIVSDRADLDDAAWAEAAFAATNAPGTRQDDEKTGVAAIRRALNVLNARHRSLSVGDTVTLTRGDTVTTVACEKAGWVSVPSPA